MNPQSALLADVPPLGCYVFFEARESAPALRDSLSQLNVLLQASAQSPMVVGLGAILVQALGGQVPGLHDFATLSGRGVTIPGTPAALLCWLRGHDRGDVLHQMRWVQQALAPGLQITLVVDAFRHGQGPNGHGRDLTGYEDGTENPVGTAAIQAALLQGAGAGLDGSSFMAVQQWVHDLDAFESMNTTAQDHMVGRRRVDNNELEDAPPSAHVKRTAQESFVPEAFVLRRSMPWAAGTHAGLMFVAFGKSFAAFEAQLRRMVGLEDGVVDALFGISKPVRSAYFWCPPMRDGVLDLRQLGL